MQAGDTLGHFSIRRKIGVGGMGEVYLAEDSRLGRPVALKILPQDLAADPSRQARFAREARAASALNHPNIAHIYDIGEHGGTHFIAMEYVEGRTLAEQLTGGPLVQDRILDIAIQVTGALETARSKGIIHRDIKPANLALTQAGDAKVLDFGLAKITGGADDATVDFSGTVEGAVLGTMNYMSPEQAQAQKVDTRSDLFSLGVVLYEMASGRQPFTGTGAPAILYAIVHHAPESLTGSSAEISPELERIIFKCLEKDPENRYQTPRDLLVDLRNLRRGDGSESSAEQASLSGAAPRRNLRPALVGVLAVVVAAVGLGAYFLAPRAHADVSAMAVLPFENETGDPEMDYLCNGMTENLINTMAQVPGLKVISRRSAFAMKGRDLTPEVAGRELGVDALLFGRVVKHDDEMTISTELVHTRDSRQLWGARYNRPFTEVQAVENEITSTIASVLRVRFSGDGAEALQKKAPHDPEAYRLYLKGREFTVGTQREMDKAIEYFQEAIDLAPDFALAYAGLAQSYTTQSYQRGSERDETVEKARAAAAKAMELDPYLAEAFAAMGVIKMTFDLNWTGAEKDLKKGVEMGPGSVPTVMSYGDYLLFNGKYDQALVQYEKAMELDPLSVGACHDLAITYMVLHQYDQSEMYFKKAIDLNPNWTWGYIKLALTLSLVGRCEEALEMAGQAEMLLTGSGTPAARSWLAYTYARCGQAEKARTILAELVGRSGSEYVDPAVYSEVYLALGEMDQALAAMERSVAERSPSLVYLNILPDLFTTDLLAEPRFQAMIEAVGFK
jgi:TolB-like protein/tetratricopeptide (TPR) repeat protein/predicted Ser/Thr protein kinase